MINLEEHKIFVESLNIEVVPLSIAIKAVEQASDDDTTKYLNQLDNALDDLKNSLESVDPWMVNKLKEEKDNI